MKYDLRARLEPVLIQETQELIGMLADAATELAQKAARGDDEALASLRDVRDEVYTLHATLMAAQGGP